MCRMLWHVGAEMPGESAGERECSGPKLENRVLKAPWAEGFCRRYGNGSGRGGRVRIRAGGMQARSVRA
jgi:hypothetical protein